MCGLFGYIGKSQASKSDIKNLKRLAILSERRGSDSSGILCATDNGISIFKANSPISKLLSQINVNDAVSESTVLLGHTRLSTHGSSEDPKHNQPVLKYGFVLFHNGIILENVDPKVGSSFHLDSELIVEAAQKKVIQILLLNLRF